MTVLHFQIYIVGVAELFFYC